MKNNTRRFLSLLLAVLIFGTAALPAWAEETSVQSAEAAAMQLMQTEGTVSVTGGAGKDLTVRDGMRLYNGYHLGTQAESYAWISLDSEKLVKLDAVSEGHLRKSGRTLELMLDSGALFFNVTKPLEEDETLNIRTSTMMLGIRGTSGWIRMDDQWTAEIYVLDGSVECSVTDPVTGQVKTAVTGSGEKASMVVYSQNQIGDKCDIRRSKYDVDEIDGFVLMELAEDPELCDRIKGDSGLDVQSVLGSAQERLERDQQAMQSTLDSIADQLAQQGNSVSDDPVWEWAVSAPAPATPAVPETPAAPQTPSVPQTPSAPSSSSSASSSDEGIGIGWGDHNEDDDHGIVGNIEWDVDWGGGFGGDWGGDW